MIAIHDSAINLLSTLSDHIASQAASLSDIPNIAHTISDIASDAAHVAQMRSEVQQLMYTADAICVTSYDTHDICTHLVDKLHDTTDAPSASAGVLIYITADSNTQFANSLDNLRTLLPYPDLLRCAMRTSSNATLEIDEMQLPTPARHPRFYTSSHDNTYPAAAAISTLESETCIAAAIADSATSPVERLKQLADTRAKQLSEFATAADALFVDLQNKQTQSAFLSGSIDAMSSQIRDQAHTINARYCCAVLLLSDTARKFFTEWLSA